MAQFEAWITSDLKKGAAVQNLSGAVFSADSLGNRFGVHVLDGGSPAQLTGQVMGYLIRADGATVAVEGELNGHDASLVLPAAAYAVPGSLDVVIQVISGPVKTTVGAWRVYVQRSTTDSMIDPGELIPNLSDLLAQISAMEAATAAATAAAGRLEGMTAAAETLAAGSSATAAMETVGGHYALQLGIPKGDQGEPGDAAAITGQERAYQAGSSGTVPPTGTWDAEVPAVPQGQYLWTRQTITWNSGDTTVLYLCGRMGLDGTGSVRSVNQASPDAAGNVQLAVGTTDGAMTSAEIEAATADGN